MEGVSGVDGLGIYVAGGGLESGDLVGDRVVVVEKTL